MKKLLIVLLCLMMVGTAIGQINYAILTPITIDGDTTYFDIWARDVDGKIGYMSFGFRADSLETSDQATALDSLHIAIKTCLPFGGGRSSPYGSWSDSTEIWALTDTLQWTKYSPLMNIGDYQADVIAASGQERVGYIVAPLIRFVVWTESATDSLKLTPGYSSDN